MSSYIEVKNVSKSFGGKAILQDVSLSIEQGTAVGLVGANGSGKSVLFKILCGFEKLIGAVFMCAENSLVKNGRDFPESLGVFINSPGFIGIYSGFQNLKFLADIQGKIGEKEIRQAWAKWGLTLIIKRSRQLFSWYEAETGDCTGNYGGAGYSDFG